MDSCDSGEFQRVTIGELTFWHFPPPSDDAVGQLDRFFVVTAFNGTDLVEWNRRAQLLKRWRTIADGYGDIGAWVWVEEAQFLDQIETLIPATIQSSIATL
jgi:hypothetical protein